MRALLAIFVGVLCLGPTIAILTEIDRAVFVELIGRNSFWKSVWSTVLTAALGSVLSVLLGFWWARLFSFYNWRFKNLHRVVVLVPYLVPNFVLATAVVVSWNPVSGLLNGLVRFPGGLYGLVGLTWLFAISHAPVAFVMLEEKLRRIDATLREAASISGASSFQVLRKIETPLVLPTVAASFAITFALCLAAFAIPAWLGAPAKVYTLSYRIYQAIQISGQDGFGEASAYALVLLAISLPCALIGMLVAKGDKKYAVVSGKSTRLNVLELQGWKATASLSVFWIFQLFAWILPIGALIATTITPPGCLQSDPGSCLSNLTLRPYIYVLFELSETKAALKGTLIYGTIAALLILLIGLVLVVAVARSRSALRWLDALLGLAASVPGALVAIGTILLLSGRFGLNLYNTPWIVVFAFVVKHMNLTYQPLRTGILNLGASLNEAARMAGANSFQVWTRIVFPILRPEIISGFFLALIPIFGELTMSIFLVSPNYRSIGTVLFDLQDYADQASAAALAVLLLILLLGLNIISKRGPQLWSKMRGT